MGWSAREIRKKTQLVRTGFDTSTKTLAVNGDTDVVELATVASQVTVQSTGYSSFWLGG